MDTSYLWILFNIFVLLMLVLDLGVFHKKVHAVKIKEAVIWSVVWISLALIFNAGVYHYMGEQKAVEFLTAYLIEKALSIDNIFVFILIFSFFKVPAEYQHKVLFWGVLGALAMRIILIIAGVALIENFHWVIYIFGLFLVYTGIKMITHKDKKFDPEKNPVVKAARKRFNISDEYNGSRFFFRQRGVLWATPLFLVLVFIEVSDLIFAVDSIPAVLAVSTDTFIVYTSNVFA
ncbi:MAG: TerC/Alx family metal homeostasis membrane protein, partial [Syntrophothermus sp.]